VNIVLIGYRGAGKTTVGTLLAAKLKRDFIDCDDYIERTSHLSIREIFELCGESYFRVVEGEALANICKQNGRIVATGGGAVLRYKNVRHLKTNGVVFFLDVDPDEAFSRISGDAATAARRPSLTGKDMQTEIKEQVEFRRPYYLKAADYTIDASKKSAARVVDEILEILEKRFGSLDALEHTL
jgi:shikimate kinase